MFENPRRGRQARNFTTNVPKILVLKSSSEHIFSRKLPLGAPAGSIRQLNFSGLQISDLLFRLSFDLGKIWILWRYFYCRWPEDQKIGNTLMPIEGLFLLLASVQAQIIVKGIRRNETATIETVRKKPLIHGCD